MKNLTPGLRPDSGPAPNAINSKGRMNSDDEDS